MYKSVSKSFPKYFFIITSNKHIYLKTLLENILWNILLLVKLQLVLSFPLSYIYVIITLIYISGLSYLLTRVRGACVRGWNPEISSEKHSLLLSGFARSFARRGACLRITSSLSARKKSTASVRRTRLNSRHYRMTSTSSWKKVYPNDTVRFWGRKLSYFHRITWKICGQRAPTRDQS